MDQFGVANSELFTEMKCLPALLTSFMTQPTLDCDSTVIQRGTRKASNKINYSDFGRDQGIGPSL